MSGTFLDEVKQELASSPLGEAAEVRAELTALLRHGGALVLVGGAVIRHVLDLETASGATARRAFALLQVALGVRPELRVRSPSGVHLRQRYGVRIDLGDAAPDLVRRLGLVDERGLPLPATPTAGNHRRVAAAVRGAFLAAGSVSAPGRSPHLELVAHDAEGAEALAGDLGRLVTGTVSTVAADERGRHRVVVKSGATIGELLAALGATRAFLRWDDHRLRRQLRGEATRLANADAANLGRTVAAASAQVAAVERLVAEVGWDGIDDDLRGVALARLTSPDATVTELGELTDPPISRTGIHRRLRRLVALADDLPPPSRGAP